ncbi:hypothetical protein J2M53_05535 [Arthrobacter sp. zg-ZUI100]|uniref:Alpha/beta hydrolase family protein n=1 Tax=Arthrobacter jiangjiafuii TaxID=2817475 RepID=A0A975M5R6_9MICC|nr:hypothetical protein [Arthrobacter jiangjiafuii]MBP3035718.1 hypothetical protein [Arthrobacter jiangjiafuii]MBP3042087.1 hypothetical protein [Arthrobacter jiangjiafuii]QWC10134.1 hypothetical protein KKR91_00235 [Arthrobacter jiangjiafuii]
MSPASPTAGTLVFLQGTGDPGPVPAQTIREQMALEPGLAGYTVRNVAWAAGAGPAVSVVPALPPRYREDADAGLPGPDGGRGLALAGMDLLSAAATPWPPGSGAGAAPDVAAAEERMVTGSVQRLVLGLVTDAAVNRRVPLTGAASDFSRSIIYYLSRGAEARSVIANALRMAPQDAPVILFGHSLGGVAAVDLLSGPEWDADGMRVDLLVTAGSQSPWLYLMGGLAHLGPGKPGNVPVPWLNFWDERDLLSFCAEDVFSAPGTLVRDVETASGDPFPASHSAYFTDSALYRVMGEEVARADPARDRSGPDAGVWC